MTLDYNFSSMTIDARLAIPHRRGLTVALWMTAAVVATSIGAQVSIPTVPVPITLQTFFVLLSGAFLGARKGAASQFAYLLAGAAGLPVFANGGASIVHLFGPTGGYLLAFPIAAFIVGTLVHDVRVFDRFPRFLVALGAMTIGLIAIFTVGVTQLYLTAIHNWSAAFYTGFTALQLWDAVKLLAAAGLYSGVIRSLRP